MRKYTKFLIRIIVGILVLFMMLPGAVTVRAEEVEENLIKLEEEGDFTVMFTYEGERPEIIFISPSGKEYAEGVSTEAELLSSHGEGWSTYKVIAAEAGQWKVRCDKKDNEEIEYVFVKEVDGLCIQSFDIVSIEEKNATLSFDVSMGEDEKIRYNYTITAIVGEDDSAGKELASGSAYTGEVKEVNVAMELSSYEGYRFMLEVTAKSGLEMYDYMLSEEFDYVNPDTPAAIEDYYTYIDMGNNWCRLDWSSYDMGWNTVYQLVVTADGDTANPVYTSSTTEKGEIFSYPVGTKELTINLYYQKNAVLSEPVTKVIDLEKGEALKLLNEEVTSKAQLELFYNTAVQSALTVKINEKEGVYNIQDSNTLYFSLTPGVNTISASFEGSNKIIYIAEKEIYYDTTPPGLKIYEDLDGMSFKSDSATISGKVENAAKLFVNEVELTIGEDGSFLYSVPLKAGENQVVVRAESSSGVGISKSMVITRIEDTPIISTKNEYLPLIISLVVSLVIVAYTFIFVRNREKVKKPFNLKRSAITVSVVVGLFDVVCIAAYVYLYSINNSKKYLEIVEESVKKAADYLTYQKIALIAMLILSGILALIIGGLVIGKKLANKKSAKSDEENSNLS